MTNINIDKKKNMRKAKAEFEAHKHIYESALLTFVGVDGFDVYNCSIPFTYNGKKHIYGRVEKREEWANSHVRLFVETAKDEFTALPELTWELEDPYIQEIHELFVLGGTHVRKSSGKVLTYYGMFYRGTPKESCYFTTGPDYMKDIRLVQLADKRIGVFSRKRTKEEAYIGFTIIKSLDELTMENIAKAEKLNILEQCEWGGVNQAYLLSSGKIGCIGHYAYVDHTKENLELHVYINISFILNVTTRDVINLKVIGTKSCYPSCQSKLPFLQDCVFTSGIVMRDDGKCDLYSGVGDTYEGRITIDYPFQGYGEITDNLNFDKHSTEFKSSLECDDDEGQYKNINSTHKDEY